MGLSYFSLCYIFEVLFGIIFSFQMLQSTGNTMVLNKVDFVNSGNYSCEVIADASFHTLYKQEHMLVIGI